MSLTHRLYLSVARQGIHDPITLAPGYRGVVQRCDWLGAPMWRLPSCSPTDRLWLLPLAIKLGDVPLLSGNQNGSQ